MFLTYLEIQKDKLNTEQLNQDGTHSLVKKATESTVYQHREKAKTSNVLILTGGIISGNHNDLYQILPQYCSMIKQSNLCEIYTHNSIQNADKGFDYKSFIIANKRREIIPNIK